MDTPSLSGIGKLHKGLFDDKDLPGVTVFSHPLTSSMTH